MRTPTLADYGLARLDLELNTGAAWLERTLLRRYVPVVELLWLEARPGRLIPLPRKTVWRGDATWRRRRAELRIRIVIDAWKGGEL